MPNHFLNIIKSLNQDELTWICKYHFKTILQNGIWKPCTKKGHCVIGIHKEPIQIPLLKIN